VILYIYTSGTTGYPKPAIIKHSRYLTAGYSFVQAAGLRGHKDDRLLIALPIYHANGALIGVGSSFVSGLTVILKKKFSASTFWNDCVLYRCTGFVYVGEVCRYLVNRPETSSDKHHNVKVAIGNGMRMNVWKKFDRRFGIKCMEFYASSEGNCTFCKICFTFIFLF
jgi:acyl-CoA synthetase (AMP-forming)/AMP-acid ligase II